MSSTPSPRSHVQTAATASGRLSHERWRDGAEPPIGSPSSDATSTGTGTSSRSRSQRWSDAASIHARVASPATPIETTHATRALRSARGSTSGAIAAASRTPRRRTEDRGRAAGNRREASVERHGDEDRARRGEQRRDEGGRRRAQGSDDDDGRHRRREPGEVVSVGEGGDQRADHRRRERGHDHRDAVRAGTARHAARRPRGGPRRAPPATASRSPTAREGAPPTRPARPGWWRTRSRPAPRRP